MPWNGSGVFSLNQDFVADRDAGPPDNVISAVKVMNELENIKAGLENCMTRTGETSPTAAISFGGQRLTSLANATAQTDAVALGQISGGSINWAGTFGGTADALTATASLAPTTLPTGYQIRGVLSADNTGAATIAINAGSAIAIKRIDGSALQAKDFRSGRPVVLTYMGSVANEFRIADGLDPEGFGSPTYYIGTAGGTADALTGTVTTTDFGAYAAGQQFTFKAAASNTTAATLNINSAGAKPIVDVNGAALTGSEISSGKTYTVTYDGTSMVLMTSTPLTANALGDLSDVVISAPSNGQVVLHNGTNFVNGAVPALAADSVTYDMLIDATQAALVGADAAGTLQEITAGDGLTIASGAITATVAPSRVMMAWFGEH